MLRFLSILMLTVTLVACKSNQGGGGKVPADFGLVIYHAGCRGNCPDYTITVNAQGNAVYEGRRAVERMGRFEKTLEKSQLKALVSTIEEYDFFAFEPEYGGGVADIPYVRTTVTLEARTHTVTDMRNAPQTLKEMEARLESIIGEDGWVENAE